MGRSLKLDDDYSPMWNEMSDRLQMHSHKHPETFILPTGVNSAIQRFKATRPNTWFPGLEDLALLASGHSRLIRAYTEEPRIFILYPLRGLLQVDPGHGLTYHHHLSCELLQ